MWDARLAAEIGAGLLIVLALVCGVAARRHRQRRDPDRIGLVDWPAVQVLALLGAFVLASIAFNV